MGRFTSERGQKHPLHTLAHLLYRKFNSDKLCCKLKLSHVAAFISLIKIKTNEHPEYTLELLSSLLAMILLTCIMFHRAESRPHPPI